MPSFEKINESIYCLYPSDSEAPVVLVKGKTNILINCGSCDRTVDYILLPALKRLGQSLKAIHGVVFTECSSRTSGGAHRLREVLTGAKFLAVGPQADRLRNPTYYENTLFSVCPDHAPPVRESRGIFVDGEVNIESRMFEELTPIPTPGHGEECVCWYHNKTKALICGENVQGNGSAPAGIAVLTDPDAYDSSLSRLCGLGDIDILLCAPGLNEVPDRMSGKAQCLDVLNRSISISAEYRKFVSDFVTLKHSQQLSTTLEELTSAYFAHVGFKPHFQGYAMLTLHGYAVKYL